MLFSVIMPCFNRRHLIGASIESVLNQNLDDSEYELIVIDDGSTDGSYEFLNRKYGDRLVLLCQKNQGPGAARNKGIERARGEYISFLDSDDQWYPWTLSVYKQVIEKHGKPSFISSLAKVFEGEVLLDINQDQAFISNDFSCFYETSFMKYWLLPGATCIRRSELEKVGKFTCSHINAEDTDLWLKLGISSGFVWIKKPYLLAYNSNDSSVSKDITKTMMGIMHIVESEKIGKYPGEKKWLIPRRRIITS